MQEQVLEFHKAFKHTVGKSPGLRNVKLRKSLLKEEAKETDRALSRRDLVKVIDGICDVLYVAIGAAVTFGIDIEPFFDEVHRSNMAKLGGKKRSDGKTLKPPGWTPPDIKGLLKKLKIKAYKNVTYR